MSPHGDAASRRAATATDRLFLNSLRHPRNCFSPITQRTIRVSIGARSKDISSQERQLYFFVGLVQARRFARNRFLACPSYEDGQFVGEGASSKSTYEAQNRNAAESLAPTQTRQTSSDSHCAPNGAPAAALGHESLLRTPCRTVLAQWEVKLASVSAD